MKTNTITFEVPEARLGSVVSELRESIKADCGTEYSESVIRNSVIEWLGSRMDMYFEDAVERLTSPSFEDAREFARMLDDAEGDQASSSVPESASAAAAVSVFNGYRSFSLEKMAAIVSHIAGKTTDLYKTKLN